MCCPLRQPAEREGGGTDLGAPEATVGKVGFGGGGGGGRGGGHGGLSCGESRSAELVLHERSAEDERGETGEFALEHGRSQRAPKRILKWRDLAPLSIGALSTGSDCSERLNGPRARSRKNGNPPERVRVVTEWHESFSSLVVSLTGRHALRGHRMMNE